MNNGVTCLRLVLQFYNRDHSEESLNELMGVSEDKASLQSISCLAEKVGFRTRIRKLKYNESTNDLKLPCIMHWDNNRFIVLFNKGKYRQNGDFPTVNNEVIVYDDKELSDHWLWRYMDREKEFCTALVLEPTFAFHKRSISGKNKFGWGFVFSYFSQSRREIGKIFFSLFLITVIQLIFPFLAKSIFDVGVGTHNLNIIKLFLACQVMLVFSRGVLDFIQNRVLLHVSTNVNMNILSDIWIKMSRLPLGYFDKSRAGEMLQRISENFQVQSFLSGQALKTLFSSLSFLVFSVILVIYRAELFLIFAGGMVIYFIWIALFRGVRRKLNHAIFDAASRENEATLQFVRGMQEMRMNSIELQKRWEWEDVQIELFGFRLKEFSFTHFQQAGATVINQTKDVLLTYIVAESVMNGQMTFGSMLAVQYILGQLAGPAEQFISFWQEAYRAKISIERLNEVHNMNEEEVAGKKYVDQLPGPKNIAIRNLSFSYPHTADQPVLKNISFDILEGKMTAIVGESGSGKTTLLKILLKMYEE